MAFSNASSGHLCVQSLLVAVSSCLRWLYFQVLTPKHTSPFRKPRHVPPCPPPVLQAQADESWFAAEQQRRMAVLAVERDTLSAGENRARAQLAATQDQVGVQHASLIPSAY